ncbi:MAG: glycosyltransferase [Flavobacteriaceae bacterium]|nr:glycosyltransferase [Flavobacteriaceae bacterium]
MGTSPLVSVITPVYNAALFLEETIQSVLNQSYTHWELILVDDCSTDSSFEIANAYRERDSRIKAYQLSENQGAGITRNFGIREASGNYIAFLDADDLWFPQKLQKQLDFMMNNNCNICYSSYQLMDEDGSLQPKIIEALSSLSFEKLLKSNYIGNLTGIYNATALGKIYAPVIRKRQDWALWLTALKIDNKALGIKEPLAYYRLRKDSVSKNKTALLKYNYAVYNKVLGLSTFKSLFMMTVFLWEHFFVKSKQEKSI